MKKEYLDILTEEGKSTGVRCLKSQAHTKGLFHATVHIWFYTQQKEILLQKRGTNKETFPNFWDVSVAGHVIAGESIKNAALREIEEEIGLDINATQLVKIDLRKNINNHPNGIKDCEFQHVFISKLMVSINDLTLQKEEIEALRLFSIKEFKTCITTTKSGYKIVPSDMSYYSFVLKNILKAL